MGYNLNMKKYITLIIPILIVYSIATNSFRNRGYSNTGPAVNYELLKNSESQDNNFNFAVLGDTQKFDYKDEDGHLQKTVNLINNLNPDFIISTGDLVSSCYTSCDKKLIRWKETLGDLSDKTYAAMGNHDRKGKEISDSDWQNVFEFPNNGPAGYEELTYSFDYQNSHFIVLNTEKPKEHRISNEQLDWLKNDLDETQKDNIFIFFHEPAFPVYSKVKESLDENAEARDNFWRLISNYNITAVFSGHEHLNSRRKIDQSILPGVNKEIYQFITGNTDAYNHMKPRIETGFFHKGEVFMLVSVNNKEINVKVCSTSGEILDSFDF